MRIMKWEILLKRNNIIKSSEDRKPKMNKFSPLVVIPQLHKLRFLLMKARFFSPLIDAIFQPAENIKLHYIRLEMHASIAINLKP